MRQLREGRCQCKLRFAPLQLHNVFTVIDIPGLAKMVLEEIRLLGEQVSFSDAPGLSSDARFARCCSRYPIPKLEVTANVLEEVFWTSLLSEEGRPCRPRIIYSPRTVERGEAAHWFEEPVTLSRDALRKLTPTQGQLGYLIWDCEAGKPEIIGVEGRQGGDVCDFTIAASNYGALDINWHCFRIVAVRAGRIDCRSKEFLPDTSAALDVIRELLESFEPVYLRHAIRSIVREGHGGSVWMLREGQTLSGIQIGHRIRRRVPPTRERHEQRFKWLESVGALAAVDGAVLLDSQLTVLGFGCFIDIPDSPREVKCVVGAGTIEKRPSSYLGGGRH